MFVIGCRKRYDADLHHHSIESEGKLRGQIIDLSSWKQSIDGKPLVGEVAVAEAGDAVPVGAAVTQKLRKAEETIRGCVTDNSERNMFLQKRSYTILLKGTQVEFKDPNECDTFLKSSWWEDSDECGIEIFHRAPLEKKIF